MLAIGSLPQGPPEYVAYRSGLRSHRRDLDISRIAVTFNLTWYSHTVLSSASKRRS